MKLKTVQTTCLLGIKQEKWKRSKKHHPKLSDSPWYQGCRALAPGGWLRDLVIEDIRKCATRTSEYGWPRGPQKVQAAGHGAHVVWELDLLRHNLRLTICTQDRSESVFTYIPNLSWCWSFQEQLQYVLDRLHTILRGDNA